MTKTATPRHETRPMPGAIRAVVVLALLYLFLVGIGFLEDGINGLGSDLQDTLFDRVSNPVAGLCVGILATVLAQSSSVTTSNIIAVLVLLPVEVATGVLSNAAEWITDLLVGSGGATYESPIKGIVEAPVEVVEDALDGLVSGTALGVALIVLGLACIFLALAAITKNMRVLIADRVERSLNALLARGGGVAAMLLGMVITMAVQSSSITTSVMVPLSAAGVITLHNAYPVTLGANVGTTITAVLASLATGRPEALTVALAHTLFNLGGIMLLYPVPFTREIPIRLAEALAELAARRRTAVLGYIIVTFIVVPAIGVIVLGQG